MNINIYSHMLFIINMVPKITQFSKFRLQWPPSHAGEGVDAIYRCISLRRDFIYWHRQPLVGTSEGADHSIMLSSSS